MSYDFRVYATEPLDASALVELVSSSSGLEIGTEAQLDVTPLFVPVEQKGQYVFTIDGPQVEDAGEVPHPVPASVLGVQPQL